MKNEKLMSELQELYDELTKTDYYKKLGQKDSLIDLEADLPCAYMEKYPNKIDNDTLQVAVRCLLYGEDF